jgi:hypothetical protein
MEITKDIPAKLAVPHAIRRIMFNINEKIANVNVEVEGVPVLSIDVDLVPLLTAATTTQKNTIKGFFKEIIAQAMAIEAATVPEIFET